ncbi:hypothetical protein [Spiroplasma chinense]|nr:hypothetical protein [Spiroplasma chinense]
MTVIVILGSITAVLGTYLTNYHLLTDSLQVLRFGDYRTSEQKQWQREIKEENSKIELNNKKSVYLLSFDGILYDLLVKYTLDDYLKNKLETGELYSRQYNIFTYETKLGFRNILGGYKTRTDFNIFNLIANSKNPLKTFAVYSWEPMRTAVLSRNTHIDKEYNLERYPYEGYAHSKLNKKFNDGKELMDFSTGLLNESVETKDYNFYFYLDDVADNAGHLWLKLSSDYIINTYKYYYNIIGTLLKKFENDPNTLVIVTTDHGRNKNGYNHDFWDKNAYKAFVVANHNLNNIINRPFVNYIDIMQAIYTFLQ